MATTKNARVYQLVKSLSKSEKRYFKLYAAKGAAATANPDYVRLFDALDAVSDYDEVRFKQRHSRETFCRNFAETKYYLQKSILRSLHVYHLEQGGEARSREMVHHATILAGRGMVRESSALLAKCRQRARAEYNTALEEDVVQMMLDLLDRHKRDSHQAAAEARRLLKSLRAIREQRDYENKVKDCYNELFYYLESTGAPRSASERKELARIMANPVLDVSPSAQNLKACMYFHIIHVLYNDALANAEECFVHSLACLNLLPSGALSCPVLGSSALTVYQWHMVNCLRLRRYAGFKELFGPVQSACRKLQAQAGSEERLGELLACYQHIFHFRLAVADFTKLDENVALIEALMDRVGARLSADVRAVLHALAVYTFFSAQDFGQAMAWNTRLLAMNRREIRPDIYINARMAEMLLQWELGHRRALRSMSAGVLRMVNRAERPYKVESRVARFLYTQSAASAATPLPSAWQALEQGLRELVQDPSERQALGYFDYIHWAASKASNKPFAELLAAQAGNGNGKSVV